MGVDAMFIVQVSERQTAEKLAQVRWEMVDAFDDKYLSVSEEDDNPCRIVVTSLGRYYGIGYERGSWPALKAKLLWLRAKFGTEVTYTGDSSYDYGDELSPTTDQEIAKLDAHFNKYGHQPYRHYHDKQHCGGPMLLGWMKHESYEIECIICDHKQTEQGNFDMLAKYRKEPT